MGHPGVQQRSNDRARGATGAHHQGRACTSAPAGAGFLQAVQVAKGVGVFAGQAAVGFHHHGVDGAYALRQWLHPVHQRQGRHFVRNGQVAARKAKLGQCAQRGFQVLGAHR